MAPEVRMEFEGEKGIMVSMIFNVFLFNFLFGENLGGLIWFGISVCFSKFKLNRVFGSCKTQLHTSPQLYMEKSIEGRLVLMP